MRIKGEDFDIFLSIFIGSIQPELVEFVRRSAGRVEPDVTLLCFSKLAAIGFGDQGACEGIGVAANFTPDQLGAGSDIAPLVRAAHLQFAVFVLVEVKKIVALYELVGEFGKGDARVEPFFHRILGHHVVHRDVLADVAYKAQETEFLHPVVIVHHFGGIFPAVEHQQFFQLLLNAVLVMTDRLLAQQVSFLRFSGGVADHAGGAADEGQWFVAGQLQVLQHHNAHQVTDVQGIGRGIDADVSRDHFAGFEQVVDFRDHIVDHPAPAELVDEVHECVFAANLMIICFFINRGGYI